MQCIRVTVTSYPVKAAWLGFLVVAASANAQDFSPLPVRNFRPYSLLFLRFVPDPGTLRQGQRRLDLALIAANSANFVPTTLFNPKLEENIETDRLDIRCVQGLARGYEVSAEVPFEANGGGFLDPIITWYHHALLHYHDIRDVLPFGGHTVFSPSGGPFSGGLGIGDLSVMLSKDLGNRASARFGIKLPTGNPNGLLGSGNFDAGLAYQKQVRLNRFWALTLNGAVVAQGAAKRLRNTRPWITQEGFGFVYAPNERDSWIAQANYESSAVRDGIPLEDKVHPSASFGYRRKLSRRDRLTAYFTEDIDPLNPNFPTGALVGPDFVIGIAWSRSL